MTTDPSTPPASGSASPAPEPTGADRRRAERVTLPPVGGPVAVVGARILDASPFGMAIECPVPLPTESVHQFRLVVGGQKEDVRCRVASCRASGPRCHVIGLEFTQVSEALRDRIREALAHPA